MKNNQTILFSLYIAPIQTVSSYGIEGTVYNDISIHSNDFSNRVQYVSCKAIILMLINIALYSS